MGAKVKWEGFTIYTGSGENVYKTGAGIVVGYVEVNAEANAVIVQGKRLLQIPIKFLEFTGWEDK